MFKVARDAYLFLSGGVGASIVLLAAGIIFRNDWLFWGVGLCGVFVGCVIFFFRDPERVISAGENDVVSPADGKVAAVVREHNSEFFQGEVIRVSIFLSVFNVHINRIPFTGTAAYYRYIPGAFLAAFKEEASQRNERTIVGITRGSSKVAFKQIAGIIARRIVCTVQEGQKVTAGERCGLIKFGSRVDVLLSLDAEVIIKKGQRVYGGLTIIGRISV